MTIINSLHILLCSRENCACRQRCLLLCQGGGEKSCRLQKERGGKRMGSKNNGAHTECLVPYLLPCLEQAIPPHPPWCVLIPPRYPSASPSPPLLPPLQRCLPQRTAGSSRISGAALLHNAPITDYSLLPPLLRLEIWGGRGTSFFITVFCEQRDARPAVRSFVRARACARATSAADGVGFHEIKCFLSTDSQKCSSSRQQIKTHN